MTKIDNVFEVVAKCWKEYKAYSESFKLIMHVLHGCCVVLTVSSKCSVTDNDVCNIETCRNILKSHDLLSAVSTFWFYYYHYHYHYHYHYMCDQLIEKTICNLTNRPTD